MVPSENRNSTPLDPIKAALDEFSNAWFSGNPVDTEEFCRMHPECGPELREEIEGFIIAAQEFPKSNADKHNRKLTVDSDSSQVIGDFRIIREIGRGGMGTVFEAEQVSLKRKVALKVLSSHLVFSDRAVLKFQREAVAGGRQKHPGIVAIHGVGEHEGIHYIAQELVEEGYTLENKLEALRKEGNLPQGYFREAAQCIAEAADALHHAHEVGVIHRDVKPSNILLTSEGLPKITDFGLAKVEDAMALSRSGDFAGTPFYMSPEQVTGRGKGVDRRTDIYSLGVSLYEMLTLKHPFEGKSSYEVLKKIPIVDPVDPWRVNARVPKDLSTICLKAMEKSPEKRYPTMKDFADDLRRYLSGEVVFARPAGTATKLMKRIKRNPLLSGAVGVAALAVLALMVWAVVYFIQMKSTYETLSRHSDFNLVYRLKAESEELWPAHPRKVEDMIRWLSETRGLLARNAQYHLEFDRLQASGQIDAEEAELKDFLEKLIREIDSIGNEESGMIMDVAKRLHIAETIREESIDSYQEEWREAISSITDEDECPRYKGLVIEPIIGFVPIGQDPESRLWEFAHLQTGKIPVRNTEGRLLLDEAMGLVFVLIPGGTFNMGAVKPTADNPMGSPNVDPHAYLDESPVHEVTLEPFFISKYEMTQGQWFHFTGKNPSSNGPKSKVGENPHNLLHPVEEVTWNDCKQILSRLGLRLPSESEWEYATRAGAATVWWTGNEKESLQDAVNLRDLYCKNNGGPPNWSYEEWMNDGYTIHAPVGSFLPNAFGLHDVAGNVFEWCQDVYCSYENTPVDGSASRQGSLNRVNRGGGWDDNANSCRSTLRDEDCPGYRDTNLGLRPARSIRE